MIDIDIATVKYELDNIPKGGKKKRATEIAANIGISVATLYREIEKKYGRKKTVKREKKIDNSLIHQVAVEKERMRMTGRKEREIATDLVIQNMIDNKVEGAEELNPSTVNRRLKEMGYRDKSAIVRVEASYANQQHQIDFSRSEYFQVQGFSGGDYILKHTRNTTSYKENEYKLRTWLVGIIDAYSRVGIIQAYCASGESVHLGIDFLNFAYNRPEDNNPFHYLPDRLKMDNGSFGKAKDVLTFLQKLDIKPEYSTPNEKRGIQKMESMWKHLWKRFELPLVQKLGNSTITLADYNALLHEFMTSLLSKPHPVKSNNRGHVYLTSIAQREQRVITEDLKKYLFRVETRIVANDRTISLGGDKYIVPDNIPIGEQLRIYKNLDNNIVGEILNNPKGQKPFVLPPTDGFKVLDDYSHRPHNTYREDVKTEAKKHVKEEKVMFMPVREKKFQPETVYNQTALQDNYIFPSAYEAQLYIGKQIIGGSYDDVADIFDNVLKEDLSKKGIDFILQELKNQKMFG